MNFQGYLWITLWITFYQGILQTRLSLVCLMHRQLFQNLFYSPCFYEIPQHNACALILQTLIGVSLSRSLTFFRALIDKLANRFYLSKFQQANL